MNWINEFNLASGNLIPKRLREKFINSDDHCYKIQRNAEHSDVKRRESSVIVIISLDNVQ